MIVKACPVVIQDDASLMFHHPLAGPQCVKGRVEPSETPARAAERELYEEAGVIGQWDAGAIMAHDNIVAGERWHFVRVITQRLPDQWTHHCSDDGGHDFGFFWHPLGAVPPAGCHPAFARAIDRIATLQVAR